MWGKRLYIRPQGGVNMSVEYAQYPWLFKGAYATYYGTTKLTGRLCGANLRVEVEDLDLQNGRARGNECCVSYGGSVNLKVILNYNRSSHQICLPFRLISMYDRR